MNGDTREQLKDGFEMVIVLALCCAMWIMCSGCSMTVRVMSDKQIKTERMGRLIWNGADSDNTMRGGTRKYDRSVTQK